RRERARAAARARTEAGPREAPRADRPSVPAQETPETRHRATLELPPGTLTMDTVRSHYRRLVAGYHPDRVVGLGAKLQRLAEEETKAINEAYAFFKQHLGG
ncbi:MAG: J domain-containing protein, partial [Bacteroidota bacterium]